MARTSDIFFLLKKSHILMRWWCILGTRSTHL